MEEKEKTFTFGAENAAEELEEKQFNPLKLSQYYEIIEKNVL